MAVTDHDRIDQVAVGPDGRLLLAMTEERSYLHDDPTVLDNDFRAELNAYLYAVQSGYVTDLARQSGIEDFHGIDIVLFSDAQPTPFISKALESVNHEFADRDIRTWWESIATDDLDPHIIESAIVAEALRLCGQRWEFTLLWVRLIGEDGNAGIKVLRNRRNEETENIEASELLHELLAHYKHACYQEGTGTWLSGQISIAGPDDYRPQFSTTNDLAWVNLPIPTENLIKELASFPRTPEHIPDWIGERLPS